MFPVKVGSTFAVTRWKATVVLLSLGFALLSAQPGQAQGSLQFFKNYFITGDYAVGGASLWQKGEVNGKASAQIAVSGVPKGADILAAYLYVQTAETDRWSGIDHATFNGYDLGPGSSSLAKALNWELATTPCWTVAYPGGRRLVTYRADVLRFLPIGPNGKLVVGRRVVVNPDGTRIVEPVDVEVPDSGTVFGDVNEGGTESGGGSGPRAIGASLVVVYRDSAMPFKAVVIYDGGFKKTAFATMNQKIEGFYQAATTPAAKMTHIVGDGRLGVSERVFLDGQLFTNPFVGAEGPKWDNPTFPLTSIPPPLEDPRGASVVVKVAPNGLLSDCLCYSGIVLSTQVKDSDGDGLLDIWETSPSLVDPNGQRLPNLKDMGAQPDQKDLFIEIGYMEALAPTTYGDVPEPAHSHLPTPAALKLVGDAFDKASIRVHFDVGRGYAAGEAVDYVIPGELARGGEAIDEMATVCTPGGPDQPWVCQFSGYPGTVGWKSGFRFLRDQVVSTPAPPLAADGTDPCDAAGNDGPEQPCERRFDRNRKDMFRYALFAHALGLPKSEDPADPGFHVPRTNTGVGDFPGGDVMVTLGAFSDTEGLPVGTPFMQASTLMHELGHNMERRHGGEAFEPNCKPTYLSVMNYLYQLRGLLDNDGKPHLDFSRSIMSPVFLDETKLSDETSISGWWSEALSPKYRIGWYAPLVGSYLEGFGTAALRHCDGSDLLRDVNGIPTEALMVRIDARTAEGAIDWNANGTSQTSYVDGLDINFNGNPGDPYLNGSDDWSSILLNQIGARRNTGGLLIDSAGNLYVGPLSLDSGRGDLGRGDLGRGDLGRGDLGRGDLGRGDLGRGDLGRGDLGGTLGRGDLGRGDLGRGDLGGGDLFVGDPDSPGGELDFETATELARTPPNEFTAFVTSPQHAVSLGWTAPNVGGVSTYEVYRVAGDTLAQGQTWTAVGTPVPTEPGQSAYTLVDDSPLSNGASYTYFAVARYADGIQSDPSNVVTIMAINDPPVGVPQSVTTLEDTPKAITLTGSDVDGGALTSYAVTTPPTHGTLSGTAPNLTYTPEADYNGPDSFAFAVSDGTATGAEATVSILVTGVNDAPVAAGQSVSTLEDTSTGITLTGSDVDGNALTYAVTTPPTHGTLSGTAPTLTYTPEADYNGPDSFAFTVSDGTATGAEATVSILVTGVNDAPVAAGQSVSTLEDTSTGITLTGSDVDGNALTYAVTTPPTHGTLSGTAPTLTYTPAPNYYGSDSFAFAATDGTATGAAATVSITVTSVNDAPVAAGQSVSTLEDTSTGITLTGSDVDGNALTYAVTTPPTHGTFSGTAPTLTYTPAPNYYGSDSFAFAVSDGTATGAAATVILTVASVNDAPTITNIADRTIDANTGTGAVSFTIGDDDLATVVVTGSTSNATLVPSANIVFGGTGANRTVTVTPAANQSGTATITVTSTDGGGLTAVDTFLLTVKPVGYGFVGVKVLPPATSGTFKPSSSGTLVDLEWKFTKSGAVVNSADALPVVTVTGPGGYSKTYSAGAGCVATNACGSFSYKTSDNKWDVHWQPKSAAVGTYYVVVTSQKTGQRFPATGDGYPVVFKQ